MKKLHTKFRWLLLIAITGCTVEQLEVNPDHYFPLSKEPHELIASGDQDFYLQPLIDGLYIPWGMTFLPDGNMLIAQRTGEIRRSE